MQEPILFNQTIKENILFGKPDATDLEIRRSCEQANALQFIETEAENKDKEEYTAMIKTNLAALLEKSSPDLVTFVKTADNFMLEELIVKTFEKADNKAYAAIQADIPLFIELLEEIQTKKGMRWDDLCVRHEWNKQMKDFVDSQSSASSSAEIQKAIK